MINLGVRKKYFIFSLIRGIITGFSAIPLVVFGIYIFIKTILNSDHVIVADQMILIRCSLPLVVINLFFTIFRGFYLKKLRHDSIYEFCDIVSKKNYQNTTPKVVYVYTCHNDMMKARVLQNAQQTYKNMEVWISEGSEKIEVIEQSRLFAKQHNLKFYAVGGKGSSNKADNLNSFLLNSGAKFDYLLITDADEALHNKFVEMAIKCFQSNKFHNLGFVSPLNYVYPTQTLFANIFGNLNEYVMFFQKDYSNIFKYHEYPNLYSASCLVSADVIKFNKGIFPYGCLEDVYMESVALRGGFSATFLPLSPCGQSFDKNIFAFYKRTMRVVDWSFKLAKDELVIKYNEKYSSWFNSKIFSVLYPLGKITELLSLSFILWILMFVSLVNVGPFILYTLIVGLISLITYLFVYFIDNTPLSCMNKWGWTAILLYPIFQLSRIPFIITHWFKSVILSRYSSFGGSGQKIKNKKPIKIKLVLCWITIVLSLFLLAAWIILFIKFNKNATLGIGFIFSLTIIIISLLFLSPTSILILHLFGKIKSNPSYSEDNFVYPPEFHKFKKIKEKFINDHKDELSFDFSVLE